MAGSNLLGLVCVVVVAKEIAVQVVVIVIGRRSGSLLFHGGRAGGKILVVGRRIRKVAHGRVGGGGQRRESERCKVGDASTAQSRARDSGVDEVDN